MKETLIENRKGTENAASLYRRFLKRFRSSGVQTLVKRGRFNERKVSKTIRKKDCLNRLEKWEKRSQLERLGKVGSIQSYNR